MWRLPSMSEVQVWRPLPPEETSFRKAAFCSRCLSSELSLDRGIYAVERSAALQRARAMVSRRRRNVPADSEVSQVFAG